MYILKKIVRIFDIFLFKLVKKKYHILIIFMIMYDDCKIMFN